MSHFNSDAVERFIRSVTQSRAYNSKEVKLNIQDAEALSTSISLLLLQERNLSQQIMVLQEKLLKQAPASASIGDVNLNGGKF
jgi:hypothetical protein